jgi:hypothetical protein
MCDLLPDLGELMSIWLVSEYHVLNGVRHADNVRAEFVNTVLQLKRFVTAKCFTPCFTPCFMFHVSLPQMFHVSLFWSETFGACFMFHSMFHPMFHPMFHVSCFTFGVKHENVSLLSET